MKNVINKIKNTKGFVSVETILVIGAVVILAGVILFFLNAKANEVSNQSGDSVTAASDETLKTTGTEIDGYDKTTFGQ